MPSQLLTHIFQDLQIGIKTRNHPYRYASLASISQNTPTQRMVVVREIEENTITIYTDSRTKKVTDFTQNANASLLFYNYEQMKQIQLRGTVSIDKGADPNLWNTISEKAQRDYTTHLAPGSQIDHPKKVAYQKEHIHFCKLLFTFTAIDYLEIKQPHHIRACYLLENNHWEGNFIVP
ncbi:pyridoxamine 5'-phosphate oxidase family protein [Aquimarina agarilytica]|uniref:pyridoxamine 5'-phosphate oxidase family protein n=1 Tax=Aquimarina agarilytica TaxID=1087449 RepID=UPI000289DCBE|nr:pyridoxamine 5'-phosphate oxidase family protein [Aquimarina agarilytica]